jgi:hypothetical protein
MMEAGEVRMSRMNDKQGLRQFALLSFWLIFALSGCLIEIPPTPVPHDIVLKSFHGRYVIAQNGAEGWTLTQKPGFTECGWFNVQYLINGKVALESCHGRYITSPEDGSTRGDWLLSQQTELSDCGQFDMYELGGDRVAFKTCAGNFWTAGDGGWPTELAWSVVAETDYLDAWELFTMQASP